jgi:prevent-host-death family protein
MCHMKKISLRELHAETGTWVRRASRTGVITVTDRGRPIARISPIGEAPPENPFRTRVLRPGYAKLRGKLSGGTDSSQAIEDDRTEP